MDIPVLKQLPNGTDLIQFFINYYGDGVVMANSYGPFEWVVWNFYRFDLKTTSIGEYYKDSNKAKLDFLERCAKCK